METKMYFLKDFIYLFLERGEGREENIDVWETHQLVASYTPPTGDLARNPGLCPDWEFNQRPFHLQAGTQLSEPHRPGLKKKCFLSAIFKCPPTSVPKYRGTMDMG